MGAWKEEQKQTKAHLKRIMERIAALEDVLITQIAFTRDWGGNFLKLCQLRVVANWQREKLAKKPKKWGTVPSKNLN